ncbi:hypothetical protein [Enterococcus sp. DIV0187]|uniref:hypothetical protein n=1 Tax=Enterococcus sp. DIV0187 TaxID=2774644 RepID=UPI003F1ED644
MPRVFLNHSEKQKNQTQLSASLSTPKPITQDPLKINRLLRQKRSSDYLKALGQLDASGSSLSNHQFDKVVDTIKKEFPEIELGGLLIGYVAKCYLGQPYEVHTLSYDLQIVEHYEIGKILPNGMEKARSLACHGNYQFVEVYTDCCRAVSEDGVVAIIK